MPHYKTICSCGKLISQCRCPSKDKIIRVSSKPCTHVVASDPQNHYTGWTLEQIIHEFVEIRGDYADEAGLQQFIRAIMVSEEVLGTQRAQARD